MYTNVDLQKASRSALELFIKGQEHGKANFVPEDNTFNAQNLNLYYASYHIEFYYLC